VNPVRSVRIMLVVLSAIIMVVVVVLLEMMIGMIEVLIMWRSVMSRIWSAGSMIDDLSVFIVYVP